ncbi:hypothetical protein Q4503_10950 [Colwellia sp. 6_MG-2023]|uniref:hypothetical protein n=1 Tax=Colwellia sp. 6_MG-2023 TaxID=3062676 RepID=UPI0026E1CDDE|nr:hypothetical protein [Colwellia sp. 6_MG-2023]MDO6488221.1 hypothetical protein [Colwellia sp. 6_MG-2023]
MKAEISHINKDTQTYAAKIEGYTDYVVIEVLEGCSIDKGDIVSHIEFKNMGKATYSNITKGYKFKVFVQDLCTENYLLKNYKMQ